MRRVNDAVAGRVDVAGCVHRPGALPRGASRRALHRAVGIVFQFHNLFAHLSALENVCLAQVHAFGRARPERNDGGRTIARPPSA